MIFVPIARERIPSEWERIIALIGPAIEHDKNATPLDVYAWLTSGRSEAFWIGHEHAKGVGVTTTEGDVCWLNYVGGTMTSSPRKFIRAARVVVHDLADLAREQGCTELRLGGRDWSRVFPDWEHFDPEHPNRIRMRL